MMISTIQHITKSETEEKSKTESVIEKKMVVIDKGRLNELLYIEQNYIQIIAKCVKNKVEKEEKENKENKEN